MTVEDAGGSPSQSSSSKRLSYVPYQRKAHSRNVSGASIAPIESPEPETRISHAAVESALAAHRSSPISTSNSRRGGAASSTPLRAQASSPRTPSALTRPAVVASPSARGLGLVRPNRDLDAPPPPLRVASKLASSSTPSASSAAVRSQQAASSASQSQASNGLAPSNPSSSAARHDRSQSTASTTTVRAADRPRSPQKLAETPRTSSRIQPSSTASTPIHISSRDQVKSNDAFAGGTPVSTSAASSLRGSSKASSAVASPPGSRSSTPIIGASGKSIPAHVNSYAALLAAQSRLGPIPVPQGVALAQAAGASTSAGPSVAASSSDGRRTAYRSGFQPKGVVRVRTGDFAELRNKNRSEGEMEAQRMDRRLAKLIAIHFAPITDAEKSAVSSPKKSLGSSFIDLDLDELKRDPSSVLRKGGSDLWSSFRARGRGEDPAIRQAEQSIVNWQDDDEVKACPICSTPFSFTVRKHHCRLCGRVVCASPHLTRLAWAEQMGPGTGKVLTSEERALLDGKCSGNIVADPISGRIEEVKEGAAAPSKPGSSAAQSKGVRVCLDCKAIVRKRQYMMDDEPLPVYMKLYEALMRVQKEIEQSLPEFQEMVLGLQKHDQTAALGSSIRANIELQRDAVSARKQLLANFATYDELAKRIRALPVGDKDSAGDAAQERIQHAIFTRANLFLQQNMLPLQSLPKPGRKKNTDAGSDTTGSAPSSPQPASPRMAPRRGTASQHANKGSVSSIASFRSLFGGGTGSASGSLRANTQADLDEQLHDDEPSDNHLAHATPDELKEQLKVLLEQEKLVADYVESAAKARKFEDAKTLKRSHDELCKEILRVQRRLVVSGSGR